MELIILILKIKNNRTINKEDKVHLKAILSFYLLISTIEYSILMDIKPSTSLRQRESYNKQNSV